MSISNTLIEELKTILAEEFLYICEKAEADVIGTNLLDFAESLLEIDKQS